MPRQSQKASAASASVVYRALSNSHWRGLSEIAACISLPGNKCSAQLKHLIDRGIIERKERNNKYVYRRILVKG